MSSYLSHLMPNFIKYIFDISSLSMMLGGDQVERQYWKLNANCVHMSSDKTATSDVCGPQLLLFPVLANPILWEEGFANRKALNCVNSRLARLTLTTDEWLQAGTFSQLELLWDLPRSSGFSTLPTSLLLLPKRSIHLTSFAHTKYIKIWHLWCYYSSDAVALSINWPV